MALLTKTPYLLGIDVGTTSAKLIVIDAQGQIIASAAPTYEVQNPRPLWSESKPQDWWQAVVMGIKLIEAKFGIDLKNIRGIGLAGQMHGLVALGREGEVVRPAILWNDSRAIAQCAGITELMGAQKLLEYTGNPSLPGFTAPKLAWMREREPEAYAKTAHVLLPKDYIRYLLSDVLATDVTDASGTGVFDVAKRAWSKTMQEAYGLPGHVWPEAFESPTACAKVSAEAAKITGLAEGTPIAAGAGDQAAAAIGCGIIQEGLASLSLGTSGVIFAHSNHFRVEPEGRLHAFCHAVPGCWQLMGVVLSAAGSYQWFRSVVVGGHESYAALDQAANNIPAGSEGLFFLPYLSGERAPHNDPLARGAFIGLSLRHTLGHMARSVLEGVSYALKDSVELVEALGIKLQNIMITGGGTNSALWRQILADTLVRTLHTTSTADGGSFGAALLGGVAAQIYTDVYDACNQTLNPQAAASAGINFKAYADLYPIYRSLYPALRPTFETLGHLHLNQ
ncbi:MAG: xylulokinase [Verrucomicrobia bacterium 21-51-4]|nr:MAG: xylulokinase [Verrucomicrobia bacterium 21-51-4]HQU08866.1 xylulokinase [Opitutales bacterium]